MIPKFAKTPEQEIKNRIFNLKLKMEKAALESVFLTCKTDIYYFSGTSQDSYLYIHIDHDPILFVKRYFPRAREESCIKDIFKISSIKQIPEQIRKMQKKLPERCGLAFDVVPVRDFYFFQKLFGSILFVDCTLIINRCRQIKSSWEIEQIKKAAKLSEKTFAYIQENLRPGISEMEFCGEFETFARRSGHSGSVLTRHYRAEGYPFHLLSGKSGGLAGAVDTPCCGTGTSIGHPFGAGPKNIKKNEPVLIDFGTILNGYHMDETRMFVSGTMAEKPLSASKAAIEILETLLSRMKPGVAMKDIFEQSVKVASYLGYEKEFLGLASIKCNFIGHSIGLELVENPIIAKGKKEILKPGMVFAVEPKFIFKNEFAAGIESVIQITEKDASFLSTTAHEIFSC